MLISRGVNLLNQISKHAKRKNVLTNKLPARFDHTLVYRDMYGEPEKMWIIAGEIVGGFVWWWFLYKMWYEYDHITGHWAYPDASKWTDEELGIPSDYSD